MTNQSDTNTKQKTFTTQNIVIMAMFAAILCISAYLSIPLPNGSHITLLNFAVTLIALLFPASQSFCIVLVWFLLGSVGVPVFIGGNAGIGYILGNFGGYSLSFLLIAILVPILTGRKYNRIRATIVAIFSAVLVDLFGMLQWMLLGHLSLTQAFVAGFASFIVLDLVKAIIAAQIVPAFRLILHTAND
ncbi:MAG: biotin transporter BioY [Eubacteriales bacterium]|nr:biotin transporter BioY [Eubacteriales bacterium]